MRRIECGFLALTLVLGFLLGISSLSPIRAQGTNKTAIDRPGDEPYTPTKLEWAALDLQASYGNTNWTSDTPVTITYVAWDDGKTVLCVLQYTPEVSAEIVKINRDAAQQVFDMYAAKRGWAWLRLQFKEKILRPHKQN